MISKNNKNRVIELKHDVLSYHVSADEISRGERLEIRFSCSESECSDVARRFDIVAVERLSGSAVIRQIATASWQVSLKLRLQAIQRCVVSFEPVRCDIEAECEERFVRHLSETDEIDNEELDVDVLEEGQIMVGEVIAQNAGLHLPDYPRAENLPFMGDEEAPASRNNPFAVLSELKKSE